MKEYYVTRDIIDETGFEGSHLAEMLNFMGYRNKQMGRGYVKIFTYKQFHNIVSHLVMIKDCKAKLPLAEQKEIK